MYLSLMPKDIRLSLLMLEKWRNVYWSSIRTAGQSILESIGLIALLHDVRKFDRNYHEA